VLLAIRSKRDGAATWSVTALKTTAMIGDEGGGDDDDRWRRQGEGGTEGMN